MHPLYNAEQHLSNWRIPLELYQLKILGSDTQVTFPTETSECKQTTNVITQLVDDDNLILAGHIRNLDEKYRNLVRWYGGIDAMGNQTLYSRPNPT
jgi:hypothetical protein